MSDGRVREGGQPVPPILEVRHLTKHFATPAGVVHAVDDVSLDVYPGETLGLVGESGSGKTTTAYMIAGLLRPTGGTIRYLGRDIAGAERTRALRREIQIVFQDPGTSLNPAHTIYEILTLPLRVHRLVPRSEFQTAVRRMMERVQLPASYMYKFPRELSEGEKQCVAIARAMAAEPKLIVLDEPTSALDVSMQARVLHLLLDLQREFGFSYLLITHDMSIMRNFATRVAIMYLGQIVETAPVDAFFTTPRHPYTQMLISSVPVLTEDEEAMKPTQVRSQGEIPSPVHPPSGCRFHTRCPRRMEVCTRVEPRMVELGDQHRAACHLYPPGGTAAGEAAGESGE